MFLRSSWWDQGYEIKLMGTNWLEQVDKIRLIKFNQLNHPNIGHIQIKLEGCRVHYYSGLVADQQVTQPGKAWQ